MAPTLWLWLFACGDGEEPPAGSQADAAAPGDAAAPADAGGLDAALSIAPVIEAAATVGGSAQIRQASSVELVITGQRLAGADLVQLGEFDAAILSAEPGEVRVALDLRHGAVPGARSLYVRSREGLAMFDGLEVTPHVLSPDAAADGLGTFESPMSLCGPGVAGARANDTIHLVAGEYACDEVVAVSGGQLVEGEGIEVTRVRTGFRVASPAFDSVTTFADLTLEADGAGIAISGRSARAAIATSRAALVGGGIDLRGCAQCAVTASIEATAFTDTPVGIDAAGAVSVVVTGSSFTGHGVGIRMRAGSLVVTETTFTGGATGVALVGTDQTQMTAEVVDCLFDDNETGLRVGAGQLRVRDTLILDNEVTDRGGDRGILVTDGEVDALQLTIAGHATSGVEAFVSEAGGTYAFVNLREVEIEGGQYGVHLHGESEGGGLVMSGTTVRGQTVASVSYGFARAEESELGGGNRLSVASGVALEDTRTAPRDRAPIRAQGITLNGISYSGLVLGPTERLPDFRIVGDGAIQF